MKQHRDQQMLAEAACFKASAQAWPKPCLVHQPTVAELKRISFSDYVRNVVLKKAEAAAEVSEDDSNDDDGGGSSDGEGVAGFSSTASALSASPSVAASTANPTATASSSSASSTPMAATTTTTTTTTTAPRRHSHNTRKRKQIPIDKTPLCKVISAPAKQYTQGMAKVKLPHDLWPKTEICFDQTARGPHWEEGTQLGSMRITSPIKQCVRGIGGIYEYTFLDMEETTVAEFRKAADEYMGKQVNNHEALAKYGENEMKVLERKFWKRLGPTMQPAMYGADMEGTLFGTNNCHGWNISKLESCLQLLMSDHQFHEASSSSSSSSSSDDAGPKGIPGVTTPYLYFGMWASVFCAHTEDMNLLSINYLHAGAPKVWYAVAPGEPARRMEQFCAMHFHQSKTTCDQYMRHKRCLLSPHILKKNGIPFTMMVQYPGDAMITFPGGYHFGFNAGFNVAEATNFAVPEWVPFGRQAGVCMCRPDSVRVDMGKFSRILLEYDEEARQREKDDDTPMLSWREWSYKIAKRSIAKRQKKSTASNAEVPLVPGQLSKQQIRKEFWIEVMAAPSVVKKLVKKQEQLRLQRRKGKRKGKAKSSPTSVAADPAVATATGAVTTDTTATATAAPLVLERWHLAKPLPRKAIRPSTRVLCIVPVEGVNDANQGNNMFNDEEELEQCFAGSITEVASGHIRIHLDGFQKKDDVWLPSDSPKVHLDGGQWVENDGDKNKNNNDDKPGASGELPKLHYWKEEDSTRRCV
mmetsp:Transcript_3287/g.9342  ORF Transcript_3287/g.9342 Transcript_3287/m.9342 type:complete len:752 (-) Transcript_3287:49-2304(-)|eukprot:CAMPEP_0119545768 /NCGR_PEP_ID=MMETSP1352-20130426/424_1 /TAXON_ID=265584 /ORGANISM="Stauroneis constricta, Strain CCMP1120" /LENGTH=751 /DNA_ID=CAMNT_0007590367 /DNA_START=209 /DNA_END=2464 /DNA_ORIENTATION=+